jgi:alditol oxidase
MTGPRMTAPGVGTTWGGTHRFEATRLHRPTSVEQLQDLIAGLPAVRALGSRHSFTGIADLPGGDLVSLAGLPADITVDADAATVTVGAGTRYGDLAPQLSEHGLALANLASLPHISIAGAVATGTHGSGDRVGSLATAVTALELVTADGEQHAVSRQSHPDTFDGMVVALGALGIVTRLTLAVEPAFEIAQTVFDDVPLDAVLANYDEITATGYSVSCFLPWAGDGVQVWVKERVTPGWSPRPELLGRPPADGPRHPVPGVATEATTEQGGVPGPWFERLPHFRLAFEPSAGDEIQSEYLVPRDHVVDALEAVRALGPMIAPLLFISEIRTMAADTLWLSPASGRATVGIHFTWHPDPAGVLAVLPHLEAALAPFDVRPHWGKLFVATADEIVPRYPRAADFVARADRMDPNHKFRNPFLAAHLFG